MDPMGLFMRMRKQHWGVWTLNRAAWGPNHGSATRSCVTLGKVLSVLFIIH